MRKLSIGMKTPPIGVLGLGFLASLDENLRPLDPQKDLIIRLGPIYDFSMEKGALIDIVKGSKVFVSGDTKYAFTPLEWAGLEILNMKDETGMFEVGSRNYVVLKELRDILNSSSKFEGPLDDQVFPNAGEGCPDANDVIDFARGLMA